MNRCFWQTLTEITALYELRDVPNVAHLEEVIISTDNVYLVMAHIKETCTLTKYLMSRKTLLEEWQIRSIMIQILEAV
jgi:serine/threonine protein kinase